MRNDIFDLFGVTQDWVQEQNYSDDSIRLAKTVEVEVFDDEVVEGSLIECFGYEHKVRLARIVVDLSLDNTSGGKYGKNPDYYIGMKLIGVTPKGDLVEGQVPGHFEPVFA